MENRNGNAVFLGVVGVATLVVAIIGATFAYFTATVEGNANVEATSYKFSASVGVARIAPTNFAGLIPLNTDDIATAITNDCVADDDYSACEIYELTFSNTGDADITLAGTLTPGSNGYANLHYIFSNTKAGLSTSTDKGTFSGTDAVDFDTNVTVTKTAGSATAYLMVYLENINDDQETDQEATFSGSLTFTDTTGSSGQLYATFNG